MEIGDTVEITGDYLIRLLDIPEGTEGIIRLSRGEFRIGSGNVLWGVELPWLENKEEGHDLDGELGTDTGLFIYENDLILVKKRTRTGKSYHRKCKGLIVCKNCRRKEMEF